MEKPRQLADVLRRVAGVHLDQVGGRGGTGSLYLRGADPNYTLVLVDGVRVNDPTNARGGSFDFSTFDVADIERVEIARGPYSAVYGGDALAGVVNIVTRRAPREKTPRVAGCHGRRLRRARNRAGRRRPARRCAAGTWVPAIRTKAKWRAAIDFDGAARLRRLRRRARRRPPALFVTGRYSETSRAGFPDDSGGYEFAEIRDTEERDAEEAVFGAGLERSVATPTLRAAGSATSTATITSIRPASRRASAIRSACRRAWSTPASGAIPPPSPARRNSPDLFSLAYGVDWLREEGSSDGMLDFGGGFVLPTSFELTRTSWAPFAEARVTSTFGLSMQAGVRVDQPDGEELGHQPAGARGIRIRGLRASRWPAPGARPSSCRRCTRWGIRWSAIPDLVPERGESYEIELSQKLLEGKARWSATWFEGEFRNAIDFDPGPPPMLVNRNRVDTQGVELAGRLALSEAWQLDASVTNVEEPHRGHGRRAAQPAGVARRRRRRTGARSLHCGSRRPRPTSARRWIPPSPPATCGWMPTRAST